MPATRRVDLLLLAVAIVWGSSYLAAKDATLVLPVVLVLFVRFALSAGTCVLALAASRTGPTRAELRAGAVLGVTQCAVLVLETEGVARTSAAHAGVLISLTVLITPLLDRAHRLPPRFLAAAGVSVFGVGLLVAGGSAGAATAGDLLVLAAACVRGGHVVLVGRFATADIRPLALTGVQTVVGTALLVPFAAAYLGRLAAAGPGTWSALIYLAVGCSVFAFLAQTWAIQRTSASRASLLLGTEPVWAVLVGVVVGGEHPGGFAIAGAVLVVGGTLWGQGIESRHRRGAKERRCPIPTSV